MVFNVKGQIISKLFLKSPYQKLAAIRSYLETRFVLWRSWDCFCFGLKIARAFDAQLSSVLWKNWAHANGTDYGLCISQFKIFIKTIKNKKWSFREFLWSCKLRQIESILSGSIGSRLYFQRLHHHSRFQLATPVDFFVFITKDYSLNL